MISSAGDIKDMTIPWLFQDLRKEKETGTVVFSRDREIKKVFFRNGDILFASSNLDEDRLGEFLMRTGKITSAQFDSSSEAVIKTGKKLGAVLFEMGILTAQDLVAQVKLQVKEIIIKLFGWRDGGYQFDGRPLPVSEIIPIHMSTGDLIIEGIRNLDWKGIRKSLPSIKTILRTSTDPSLLFQSVHLDQDQRTVFSLIDGSTSIQELCVLSGIGDFNTLKAVYAMLALRMAETGEIKTREDKIVSAVVRETVAAEVKKEEKAPATEISVTKETLQNAFDSLGRQNHYEVLEVGHGATALEIKKAYFHLAKHYHPDRHFEPEMSDMKEKLEALFSRIHDAYETLSSPTARKEYNIDLASGADRDREEGKAHKGTTANRETARAQFNEGIKQFNQGNFWGAEEAFEWAIRLDPGNAEYVFRRGLTLARIPRRGHEAEEHFVRAIEKAPKKSDYHLELGNFYARSGLKEKALAAYRNALQHDPMSDKITKAIQKISG
ncbi:MAG: DnaJ domain-containing protein [Nitrospirae bacterium]|nr:DnaJ domain-containing protein [Nitrospirota bacterium]